MKTNSETFVWWSQILLVAAGVVMLTCLPGCSAAGEPIETKVRISRCAADDIFDPGPPELEDSIRWSAEQWEKAIGRPVCVEDGGLPFILQDEVYTLDGIKACGYTLQAYTSDTEIWLFNVEVEVQRLAPECFSYDRIILHEMGHALGRTKAHTATGLMQAYAEPGTKIDRASIELVCANSQCG